MATAKTATIRASINDKAPLQETPAPLGHNRESSLEAHKDPKYISVITRVHGKDIIVDTRICDIADFKARQWLVNKHMFWATAQGHSVETHPAGADEVQAYMATQTQLLQRRFGK